MRRLDPLLPAIEDAHAAMADGDFAAALAALLAAWRATPAAAIADAIDRVGARAGRDVKRPAGATPLVRDRAWDRLAATADPVPLDALCATVREGDARSRIVHLVETRRDPRLTRALVDVLLAAPGLAYQRFASDWRGLFAALAAQGDARVGARTDELRERWRKMTRNGGARGRTAYAEVDVALTRARVVKDAKLPPLVAARLAAVVAHPALADARAGEAGALLAAIYADPASDGPRAVYADWLQERGDPRGELIALQLAPPTKARANRAAELVKIHGATWLGELAPHAKRVELARGFPRAADVRDRPAPAHAWATFEAVTGDIPVSDEFPMPVLREARAIKASVVARLAQLASPPPLEVLALEPPELPVLLSTLARLRLPALRELRFRGAWNLSPANLGVILAISPVLEQLAIGARLEELEAWRARASATDLARLVVETTQVMMPITWTRDASGALTQLALTGSLMFPMRGFVAFVGALDALPASSVTAIALERVPVRAWTVGMRRLMARALARHPNIRTNQLSGYTPPR